MEHMLCFYALHCICIHHMCGEIRALEEETMTHMYIHPAALNELFTRHLLTAEECSEMARKGRKRWKNHLTLFLLTKPAEVMQEACQVLEKHGCPVKEELKSEFYYSSTL